MEIIFGAMSQPISEQLKAQHIQFNPKPVYLLESFADCVSRLAIHGILTEAETNRARKRIMKKLKSEVTGGVPESGLKERS